MKSPQGTIFQTTKWITKSAELSLKKEILYGFFKNDNLIAGCSVYAEKKYSFLKTAVSTVPMTPYGGYIFTPFESTKIRENEHIKNNVISAINNEMIKKFDYIKIINTEGIFDIRPFIYDRWRTSIHYTYFFNLDGNIEEKASKKVRNTIRKSLKNGINVKKETDSNLYYRLYCKTFERQNLIPPVSERFFSQMIELIISNNLGEMWIARTPTEEPAAGEIIIWDNKRAHRWSAVSDPVYKDSGATSQLLFEIFSDLQKRGIHEINLMAGNTPQLTKFVSSFNPRLIPYYAIEKFNSKYNLIENILYPFNKIRAYCYFNRT